jgi:hypothetical protein
MFFFITGHLFRAEQNGTRIARIPRIFYALKADWTLIALHCALQKERMSINSTKMSSFYPSNR